MTTTVNCLSNFRYSPHNLLLPYNEDAAPKTTRYLQNYMFHKLTTLPITQFRQRIFDDETITHSLIIKKIASIDTVN